MKIGIYLGYGPQVILGKEGLGRYIAGLLKGFLARGDEVTIACPHWLLECVQSLGRDFQISDQDLHYIHTLKDPPLWNIYKLLHRKESKGLKSRLSGCYRAVKRIVEKAGKEIAVSRSFIKALLWCLCLGLIVLLPVFLLVLFAGFLLILLTQEKLFLCIIAILTSCVGGWLAFKKAKPYVKKMLPHYQRLKRLKRKFKPQRIKSKLSLKMFNMMLGFENELLVKLINSKEVLDVWYVPAIFWPQVNQIRNSTVVINAPDLVSQEFAYDFADVYNSAEAIAECRKTLEGGAYFITYCETLRKELLLKQYSVPADRAVSVPHATNNMAPYLQIDQKFFGEINQSVDWSDVFARELVPSNIKYIFYASQVRPSKNIFNLVKAYEYLLRRCYIGHKLYLTCDPQKSPDLYEYIKNHQLQDDIRFFYNLPARQLAAFYHCADLVVNPTLYEGGFPFTYGEALSVGTPCILSDIPQTREVIEPQGLEEILFDPYEWKKIADKIEWALKDLDGLYRKELPFYQELEKRDYSMVAAEYEQVFRDFIAMDQRVTQ